MISQAFCIKILRILKNIFKIFKFVKFMRKDGKDINGGGCMKDKDGRLVVSAKDRGKLWKDHMEKMGKMNGIKWQKQIWLNFNSISIYFISSHLQ